MSLHWKTGKYSVLRYAKLELSYTPQCAGTEASHSSTMHGRSRNRGCAETASSAARTSRSILRLDGDPRVGAEPSSGPYTRQGVKRAPFVWNETKSSGAPVLAQWARKPLRNSLPR